MTKFGASLYAAAQGRAVPRTATTAPTSSTSPSEIVAADPALLDLPADDAVAAFTSAGEVLMVQGLRDSLARFRVEFDVWFSERTLHESGAVEAALATLREQGHVYEEDGAVWLRTTDFGDDKDRVLVRSNGELTYFASDAAYYLDKRRRGFDRCVYMLGADHHGYVDRLKAHRRLRRRRPGPDDRGADRPAGQARPRGRGGPTVASGPARSSPWTTSSTSSGSTPADTPWRGGRPTPR